MKIIGIDPGLANFGLAVIQLGTHGDRDQVTKVMVIRTEKSDAARKIRVADDTSDRARFLVRELHREIHAEDGPCVAIAVEAVALPFGKVQHKVVSQLGRVRGLIDALAEINGIPIVEEGPQRLKKLLTGTASASKEDVRKALGARWPRVVELWPPQKTLLEHASDAVGMATIALDSDVVKAARRAWEAAA